MITELDEKASINNTHISIRREKAQIKKKSSDILDKSTSEVPFR